MCNSFVAVIHIYKAENHECVVFLTYPHEVDCVLIRTKPQAECGVIHNPLSEDMSKIPCTNGILCLYHIHEFHHNHYYYIITLGDNSDNFLVVFGGDFGWKIH